MVGERDDEGLDALAPAREADGERPADSLDTAVERQLAHDREQLDLLVGDGAGGREDADRDRQIERGAFLADVRRGEIDRDPIRRKGEACVADGRPDSLPALANGGVRQSDGREGGQSRRHVNFHSDQGCLDPDESGR